MMVYEWSGYRAFPVVRVAMDDDRKDMVNTRKCHCEFPESAGNQAKI
jgi:hypothetical protein